MTGVQTCALPISPSQWRTCGLESNGELVVSNPTIHFIISQGCVGIEFMNQRFTHFKEITKEFVPTSILKTTWDKVILQIYQVYKSFLNNWSFLEELIVSFKVLGRVEPSIVNFLPFVRTMCSSLLLWSYLQEHSSKVHNTEHNIS